MARRVWRLMAAAVLLGLLGCGGTREPEKVNDPTPSTRFPGKR
jgi:hypothetical protein